MFSTDDCISSALGFTSSLVNNSFTSAADSSIFPLIMFSGVNRQNTETLISTQQLSSATTLWRCSSWKPIKKLKNLHGECFKHGQPLRPLPKNRCKWLPLNNARFLINGKTKQNKKYPPTHLPPSFPNLYPHSSKRKRKKRLQHCQSLLRTIPRSLGQLWLSKRIPL